MDPAGTTREASSRQDWPPISSHILGQGQVNGYTQALLETLLELYMLGHALGVFRGLDLSQQ